MTALTVTCNVGGMPMGLIPMQDAVARLARHFVTGETDCYALVSDENRSFRSAGGVAIPAPLVIVTRYRGWVDISKENRRPSRHAVFARDGWTCQYCEQTFSSHRDLTIDHVKPAHMFPSRSAATTWENVVACCEPCNRRKGGLLPREAKRPDGRPMLPLKTPRKPDFVQLRFGRSKLHPLQRDYVDQFFNLKTSGTDI